MVFSRIRKSIRAMKNLEKVEAGLPPDDAVVLDADYDEPPLVSAASAARRGDWTPAARLLAATEDGPDWELRAHHISELATVAVDADQWLHGWQAQRPDDPNLLVMLGEYLIAKAWALRGAKLAAYTSDEQFAGFFHHLEQVEPVLRRATARNPADPTPWASAITLAMGSRDGRRDLYDEAWRQLARLDPSHRSAHSRALQYVCDKWHGSHEEMFTFAYRASDSAAAGSPLHVLPLRAWTERDLRDGGEQVLKSAQAREAVNRALTVCPPHAPASYRWDRADRNLLVRTLFAQERYEEAYGQLQALGVHATSFPWDCYSTNDARVEFVEFRKAIMLSVAEEMP